MATVSVSVSSTIVPLHDDMFLTIDTSNALRPMTQRDGKKIQKMFAVKSREEIQRLLNQSGYKDLLTLGVAEKSSNY